MNMAPLDNSAHDISAIYYSAYDHYMRHATIIYVLTKQPKANYKESTGKKNPHNFCEELIVYFL
jgi:hypothetical protein